MRQLRQDVRITLRGLGHSPTFTATVVLVLGLGIGMAVAMFTVFEAVLLRALPVLEQDRIVVPRTVDASGVDIAMAPQELDELRRESRTLSDVAGVAHQGAFAYPMVEGDQSIVLDQARVTGNFFELLGARPALGRLLRPEDDVIGAPPVLVLSYETWRRQFGGDSAIVGRQLTDPYLQWSYTIIGVAPAGLGYPVGVDYWIPPPIRDSPLDAIARLTPNVTMATARGDFFSTMQAIDGQRAASGQLAAIAGVEIRTFPQAVVGDVRPALRVLTAAVVLLLLIACVNVGNLLLLRLTTRAHEIAIRRALGASSVDIARQLLVESGTLTVGGGLVGFAGGGALLRLLLAFAPAGLPQMDLIRFGGASAWITAAVTTVAVVLVGILPLLTVIRGNLASPLRFNTRSSDTKARLRVRQWLVGSQVALALVMLAGAGLLVHSLERLERVKLGYTADHLSFLSLTVPITPATAGETFTTLLEEVAPRLRALPGVIALTPAGVRPFMGPHVFTSGWEAEGQAPTGRNENRIVPVEVGGPEYFRTLDIPLLRGRGLLDSDGENSPGVVVVSEAAARLFWPGQDPIGKRIRFAGDTSAASWRTVVGIAGDIRYRTLRVARPTMYVPWRQFGFGGLVAVRTTSSLQGMLPAMRRVVHEVNPEASIVRAQTMDELLASQLTLSKLSSLLLSGFGLVALLLVAIGLYGVMASAVRERTRELGVRAALGASPERLRREVLQQAFTVAGAGALVGIAGALATSRLLGSLLFQVSPTDPVALVGACGLLLVVALLAAFIPARRATAIDPAQALRAE